jgi:hypothetical protein
VLRTLVARAHRQRAAGDGERLRLSRIESISGAPARALLQAAWVSPLMPDFMASLPALGLDGTLRRQRQNVGQAHLKTGSLNEVSGVAGYVHGANGRRYVLVAIANHPKKAGGRAAGDPGAGRLDRAPALEPFLDPRVGVIAEQLLPARR